MKNETYRRILMKVIKVYPKWKKNDFKEFIHIFEIGIGVGISN